MSLTTRKTSLRLCALFGVTASLAFGSFLPPGDEVVEAMMEAQGQDLTSFVRFFGADPAADLKFTSAVDANARTFSYSLQPSTTFFGLPLSISSTGTGNNTDLWSWTTAATFGTQSFTMTGTYQFVDPPNFSDFINLIYVTKDQHSEVTYDQTASRTVSIETTTFTMFDPITLMDVVYATAQRIDTHVLQGPDAGKWVWGDLTTTQIDGHALNIQSHGFSPLDGGAGTFDVTFTPEPMPVLLTALGLAALGFRKGRGRLGGL